MASRSRLEKERKAVMSIAVTLRDHTVAEI